MPTGRATEIRRIIVTAIGIEVPGILLIILGLTVLDDMRVFWVGIGVFVIASVYLLYQLITFSRGPRNERLITPPGQ